MRRGLALVVAATAFAGTADAAAPVRGGAFCWDFDLAGTDAADRLVGTSAAEHAASYGGDDELTLYGGDDCASAGAGHDVVHLGPGNDDADTGSGDDHVFGGPGDDVLVPGIGADRVEGGDGDDLIRDEQGDEAADLLAGGDGHDVIRAVDAGADDVDCGPGYDVAFVDPADQVRDCERVVVARAPRLTARPLRTGVRPAFAVRWTRADLPPAARVVVQRLGAPARRPGCAVAAWRVRGAGAPRVVWRGRRGACPGEYAFRLTHVAGTTGRRVACERLEGTPRAGCPPTERLGVLTVAVR